MSENGKRWCAVPGCMDVDKEDERHFFAFPKEHDRWLKWIKASKRLDLELKGPDYANRNCRICHFHFEEKWLIRKTRMRLNPDAVPTIFFGPAFDEYDIECVKNAPMDTDGNCISIINEDANVNNDNNMGAGNVDAMDADNMNAVNAEAKQSTSRSALKTKKSSEKSSNEEKLLKQVMKLRQQNSKLRKTVNRLRLKQEKNKPAERQDDDVANLRELSG